MSTESTANPVKIAIVGMSGSGKTVLVTTLAVKMAQMSIKDVYMGPIGKNRRQTIRYTQDNWQMLIDGKWPPSTPVGELIRLQWELNTRNCQATVQFLDCAGQDIRSLFSDEEFNPASLYGDLKIVYDSVNSANVLIFLVNMKDLLAKSNMTDELLDLDQMIHILQQRNDIPRRMAVAFSQYDKYKPEVDQKFNGDFQEYVRHYLPYLYGQYKRFHRFELIPVAAVNDTQNVIEDGVVKQYPAPDFSSYNLETLIRWIADSVEELAPELEKSAPPEEEEKREGSLSDLFLPGTKAGDRISVVINNAEFAFRWCPPGEFLMKPSGPMFSLTSNVTLTKGFWMMETEVTQRQWKAIMGTNPSHFVGDDLPVEQVSWNDCQEFCNKCAQLGLPIQLPTAAQWQYACQAGTNGAFKGNLDEIAWYWSNSDRKTHPVGTKKPNAWGLYDMRGNVMEWCSDKASLWQQFLLVIPFFIPFVNIIAAVVFLFMTILTFSGARGHSLTDPTGTSTGSLRVIRSSCYSFFALACKLEMWWITNFSSKRLKDIGFRCVIGQ